MKYLSSATRKCNRQQSEVVAGWRRRCDCDDDLTRSTDSADPSARHNCCCWCCSLGSARRRRPRSVGQQQHWYIRRSLSVAIAASLVRAVDRSSTLGRFGPATLGSARLASAARRVADCSGVTAWRRHSAVAGCGVVSPVDSPHRPPSVDLPDSTTDGRLMMEASQRAQ